MKKFLILNLIFITFFIPVVYLQLLKLIEAFELFMISDLRKSIVRQTDLVIKERNREEGNLPIDLWKRPVSCEDFLFLFIVFTLHMHHLIIKNYFLNSTLLCTSPQIVPEKKSF